MPIILESPNASGGGGSGTVTNVSSANTGIAVANPTTTPVLTLATLDVIATDGPPAAAWSNNSKKITAVADPASAQDAATKNYVDNAITGLEWKAATRLATAAALPTNTYSNGASGVGATLTATLNGALTVDGTAVATADRVLVKNEVAGANNGIYVVTATGSVGTPYVLTRATDYDQAAEITQGASSAVISGTANAETAWTLTTAGAVTVGTTALTYAQIAAQAVSSVFTRTGAVTAQSGDYTAAQVGALASTASLDVIATANATAANWSNNSHKITSVSNGTAAADAAAFGQLAFPNLVTQATFATATQTITASTTLTNDTALSLTLGASATEVWFFEIFWDFNAANVTMDLKLGFATVPSSATIRWGMGYVAAAAFAGFAVQAVGNSPTAPASELGSIPTGLLNNAHNFVGTSGFIYGGGTGGTITPQWAQNTSDAGNLIRQIGSWLRAWKVVA